jgi:hypothetical protein
MFAIRFRGNANHLALAYGGPLYLVGSMLTSLTPGDIDLRLMLDRQDIVALYGEDWDKSALEWSAGKFMLHREELKQSRRLDRRWRHAFGPQRFDFQIKCGLFSDVSGLPIMEDKPHVRLDAVPLDYFRAGRGDP